VLEYLHAEDEPEARVVERKVAGVGDLPHRQPSRLCLLERGGRDVDAGVRPPIGLQEGTRDGAVATPDIEAVDLPIRAELAEDPLDGRAFSTSIPRPGFLPVGLVVARFDPLSLLRKERLTLSDSLES
jgi:hypothetical protein